MGAISTKLSDAKCPDCDSSVIDLGGDCYYCPICQQFKCITIPKLPYNNSGGD